MNKLWSILLITLVEILLVACNVSGPIQPGEGDPIRPGDKVGNFTITNGGQEAARNLIAYMDSGNCKQQGSQEIYICQIATGEKHILSPGIYSDLASGKSLDSIWDAHTMEMFIDNRPVDLAAFGSIEAMHPRVGPMRFHDIAIQTDKPGEIVVRTSGVIHDKSYEDTTTYRANAP
jgi:hypothetical protein